jgi:hypothetical protein
MDRKRLLRLLSLIALAGGLAAALPLGSSVAKRWPRDQTVRYLLGDAAPRVVELDARWAEIGATANDPTNDAWSREVTFRYAPGEAPRVVTHEPRMPDGDYTVEIDVVSDRERSTITRHVKLEGGSTSIDVDAQVGRSVPPR